MAKIGWLNDLSLDHPHVAPVIADAIENEGKVMLHEGSSNGKAWLRLRRDREGRLFVLVGFKGRDRLYLDRCDVTVIDGEAIVHKFKAEGL